MRINGGSTIFDPKAVVSTLKHEPDSTFTPRYLIQLHQVIVELPIYMSVIAILTNRSKTDTHGLFTVKWQIHIQNSFITNI